MKGFGILYKKINQYFQNYFSKILDRIIENIRICTKMPAPLIINSRIVIRISDKRAWHPLKK